MLGRRERLTSGWEWDALTKGGKRVHKFKPGIRKWIKAKANRRARRGFDLAFDTVANRT